MSKYLTIEDVAERLQVEPSTVRAWQYKGELTFVKLPQGIRISEDELQRWIDRRTIKAKKKIA